MSNTMGSYAYYSCEMGVPFSLYGNRPKNINISNPYYPKGDRRKISFFSNNFYFSIFLSGLREKSFFRRLVAS